MTRTPTPTLITALRILAAEIQSGDGVANAAIAEAADRLEEMSRRWVSFNVNHKVRVKLTEHGRRIHRCDFAAFKRECPEFPCEYTPPKEDADGWSEWQMWDLMKAFGPHTAMGSPICFETTIELEATP